MLEALEILSREKKKKQKKNGTSKGALFSCPGSLPIQGLDTPNGIEQSIRMKHANCPVLDASCENRNLKGCQLSIQKGAMKGEISLAMVMCARDLFRLDVFLAFRTRFHHTPPSTQHTHTHIYATNVRFKEKDSTGDDCRWNRGNGGGHHKYGAP